MRKPRVLFVGRTRYRLPLDGSLAKKWDAIARELDYRVLATAAVDRGGDERFELVRPLPFLDGALFYGLLPLRMARAIRRYRPEVVMAEDPHVAAAALLARRLAGEGTSPRVVVEVHGNWRYATRLYGSPARRLLAPLVDAVDAFAVRRADAVRTLSPYTSTLVADVRGRAPDYEFPTYSDLEVFAATPPLRLPDVPTALFVGALERYKNVDGVVEAWRRVACEVPHARLAIVGRGPLQPLVAGLVREFPDRVYHVTEIPPAEVARRMDESWVLVLPSRFEGFGRVVIESFARGRGVIGGTGGVLDLVEDGENGLLVDPENVDALASALVRVLSDRPLAERLGAAAARAFASWHTTPAEFAVRVRGVVEAALH